MKVLARSKRVKAFFGLIFPILYIPFPIYYYNKYPERLIIDPTGSIIILFFGFFFIAYYLVNGYGFLKTTFSKSVISIDTDKRDLYIYDNEVILAEDWVEISIGKKFGLDFFYIKNNYSIVKEVYANCASKDWLRKSKYKNNHRV